MPVFLLGLCAVTALTASSSSRRHASPTSSFEQLVLQLRRGLDVGRDADALVPLAEQALIQISQFAEHAPLVHFLAGSAYLRQAEQTSAAEAQQFWLRAAEHLEQALAGGVEERDRPALEFRLGLALYRQSKDLTRAIELMAQGLDGGAGPARAGYQALLQACLDVDDVDGAVTASQRALELIHERDADALARARLQHAQLLERKGLRGEAIKELDRIPARAAASVQAQARVVHARWCQEEALWSEAARLWQEIVARGGDVPGGRAAALLQLGWCHRQAQPANDTAAAAAWQQALDLGGAAGQAAGLRLGELGLGAEPPRLADTLTAWRRALAEVHGAGDFNNPHFDLGLLRALFDRALRQAADNHLYAEGQGLAELYRHVAEPGVAETKLAEITQGHARCLQRSSDAKPETVRAEYRRAGQEYEQAASSVPEKGRAEQLLQAIRAYVAASEPVRAAAILERVSGLERNDERVAESWFSLGETFRTQGKNEAARQAFTRCIEFPTSPYACRARYQLALELVTKKDSDAKDLTQARDILEQNLKGPIVDRESHEKSLYKLGAVLAQLRDFDRAALCLKEATSLYPNNALALYSREQLGECYRRLAEQAYQRELEQEKKVRADLTDDKRTQLELTLVQHRRSRRDWLEKSARAYQALHDELEARGRLRKKLTDMETTLLRRALFNIAENHFDLGEYFEALRLYRLVMERFKGKVEALIACERICRLAAVMTQTPAEARLVREAAQEAVRRAEQDVHAMPDDDFQGQQVWSRQDWVNWLGSVRTQLAGAS